MADQNEGNRDAGTDRYRERGRAGEGSTGGERISDYPGEGDWGSQARWGAFGNRTEWTRAGSGNPGSYAGGLGQYAGRGPKGWQRPDDSIREDINERLTGDPQVDASGIEVRVESGEVTLAGTVADRGMKRRAEDIAHAVNGVKDVHNRLAAGEASHPVESGEGR